MSVRALDSIGICICLWRETRTTCERKIKKPAENNGSVDIYEFVPSLSVGVVYSGVTRGKLCLILLDAPRHEF